MILWTKSVGYSGRRPDSKSPVLFLKKKRGSHSQYPHFKGKKSIDTMVLEYIAVKYTPS